MSRPLLPLYSVPSLYGVRGRFAVYCYTCAPPHAVPRTDARYSVPNLLQRELIRTSCLVSRSLRRTDTYPKRETALRLLDFSPPFPSLYTHRLAHLLQQSKQFPSLTIPDRSDLDSAPHLGFGSCLLSLFLLPFKPSFPPPIFFLPSPLFSEHALLVLCAWVGGSPPQILSCREKTRLELRPGA